MNFAKHFPWRLRTAHAEGTPFMATLPLIAQANATNLDVASIPGLVATHVAVDATEPLLVTYWRTKEDFERSGNALREAVGATTFSMRRFVADYREPRLPFRKRVPWQTMIATLLAFIGALDGVRLVYNHLRARPEVLLAPRAGTINYLTDDPIDEPLAVTNRTPVEQRLDVLSSELWKNGVPTRELVTPNPQSIRDLAENQTEQIRLRTTATEPGSYRILTHLRIHAGWLARQDTDFPIDLTVWSSRPRVEKLHILRQGITECDLEGELLVGVPASNGLVCRVTIAHHPEITAAYPTGLSTTTIAGHEWTVHGERDAALGGARFLVPPLPGFKRQRFNLHLESAKPTKWQAVFANTEISVELRPKETT